VFQASFARHSRLRHPLTREESHFNLAELLAVSSALLFGYQQIGQEQLFNQLASAPRLGLYALVGAAFAGAPAFAWATTRYLSEQESLPEDAVQRIARHYGWDSVEAMRANWKAKRRDAIKVACGFSAAIALLTSVLACVAQQELSWIAMTVGATGSALFFAFAERELKKRANLFRDPTYTGPSTSSR